MTARCTVVSTEASTHAPHYETVLLLTRMTTPPSGPLASLAHFVRGCSVQERPTAPPSRPLADPGSTDMADLARTHAHAGCCTAASRQPAILNGRRSDPFKASQSA